MSFHLRMPIRSKTKRALVMARRKVNRRQDASGREQTFHEYLQGLVDYAQSVIDANLVPANQVSDKDMNYIPLKGSSLNKSSH